MLTLYIIIILLLLSVSGYKYGDHMTDYRFTGSSSKILKVYSGIADANACEQKCVVWSGTPCKDWSFKDSGSGSGRCVIGTDPILTGDTNWISGINKVKCGDMFADCVQDNECDNLFSNEPYKIDGANRLLTTGGTDRCYRSYVPNLCKNNQQTPCKLVFNFHGIAGFGGNGKDAISWANARGAFTDRVTGIAATDAWSQPGIVIYPQNWGTWGWQFSLGPNSLCPNPYDDVQYIYDILQDLKSNDIHWSDVYSTGESHGGMFTQDLVAKLNSAYNVKIKGIAVHSAQVLLDSGGCVESPGFPVHVLMSHAYNDDLHDYDGHAATGCDMGRDNSRNMIAWWGTQMSCTAFVVEECYTAGIAPNCIGGEDEKKRSYNGCAGSVDVILQSTQDGHQMSLTEDALYADFFNKH